MSNENQKNNELSKMVDEGASLNADLDPKTMDNATKSEAAVALKMRGANYTRIAEVLEYSSARYARIAVEKALAASAGSELDRDKFRELTIRRLERMIQSVSGKALKPNDPQHLAYNARMLALIDREAKIYGIDAAINVTITPTDEAIQAYIQKFRPQAEKDMEVLEAEIIEMDGDGDGEP